LNLVVCIFVQAAECKVAWRRCCVALPVGASTPDHPYVIFRNVPGVQDFKAGLSPASNGFKRAAMPGGMNRRDATAKPWKRGSESNDISNGCQPQYPDVQGYFNIDSKGLQAVFGITRHLTALTCHAHPAYSVIEEIVEGFVEGF
jgi:hypothetical protein